MSYEKLNIPQQTADSVYYYINIMVIVTRSQYNSSEMEWA